MGIAHSKINKADHSFLMMQTILSSSLWIDFSNWHNIFWKATALTKHHSFWRWISFVDRIKHHLEWKWQRGRLINKNAPFLVKNEMWRWSTDQMYVLWNQAGPQSPCHSTIAWLCEYKQVMKSFCVSVSSSMKADGDDTYLIMLLWDEIMCIKYFHGADTYYLLNKQ